MSHFAVLVVGDDIEEKLAPYQENNMGTCAEEYLEFVSVEDDYRKEYEEDSIEMWKNGDDLEYTWPERFKVGDILNKETMPDADIEAMGWEKVFIAHKDRYDTFEEFIEDWAGYDERNEETGEFGYYENPNAKWDWYQIGGRYAGRFKLKENIKPETSPNFSWGWDSKSMKKVLEENKVDQALKGEIDWDVIHNNWADYDKALRFWEMKVEGDEPETEEEKEQLKWDLYKPEFYTKRYGNKHTYAQCISNFTMWAIVTEDGKWIEKGEMGWFGMSGESHDEAIQWELNFFDEFIKPLDDDILLTIVDCHI